MPLFKKGLIFSDKDGNSSARLCSAKLWLNSYCKAAFCCFYLDNLFTRCYSKVTYLEEFKTISVNYPLMKNKYVSLHNYK